MFAVSFSRRQALFVWLWLVLVLCGGFSASRAQAATELRTLIDSDNNATTGCTVMTASGVFTGVDLAAVTQVDLSASDPVGNVTREICQGGVLVPDPGFAPTAPLQWPVGVAVAGVQLDVVESYAQLLAAVPTLRLGFTASTTDASLPATALLSANGGAGAGVLLSAASAPVGVPALGGAGLLGLAVLLLWATHRSALLRRWTSAAAVLCLVFVVGLAWSAIVRDGAIADWSGATPVARSSTSGVLQIAAMYARLEGNTLQLRYDVDLGLRDGVPQEDGPYTVTVGTPLTVPAPGLLTNDSLGAPPMQVQEFRVQGSGTSAVAGGSVGVAGATLSVQADGGFTLGAPSMPGTFKFEYRARNRYLPGGWSIATLAVAPLPSPTCGNGVVEAGEACDDGNIVTETSCPGGAATCLVCNSDCSAVVSLPVANPGMCGNGVVEPGEVCDDGNTVNETSCPYGTANCTTCNSTCTGTLKLTGGYCGDNTVNGPEVCDDGNTTDETSCPYGTANCMTCNSTCSELLPRTGGMCGDGVVSGPEVCDDGNNATETSCPYGTPTCMACAAGCLESKMLTGPYCGDGIVNGNEACDGTADCTNMCTLK